MSNIDELKKETEEFVDELKKKVVDLKNYVVNFDNDSLNKAVDVIKNKTSELLNDTADKAKHLWDTYSDPKEIEKILGSLKVVTENVYKASLKKIDELKKNKDIQNAISSAEEYLKKTFDKTTDFAKESFDKVLDIDECKEFFDKTSSAFNSVKDNVTEYLNKPEVKDNIDKAKDITVDIAEKGVAALKKWLKK